VDRLIVAYICSRQYTRYLGDISHCIV
jgi:hypothetical protein